MTKRTPPYSPEVRARAVRIVLEHQPSGHLLVRKRRCLMASRVADARARARDHIHGLLAAGEISLVSWPILRGEAASATMRLLAEGIGGGPPIVSAESGCSATAELIAGVQDPALRIALDLDERRGVAARGSEGATAPEIYVRMVGRPVAVIEVVQR